MRNSKPRKKLQIIKYVVITPFATIMALFILLIKYGVRISRAAFRDDMICDPVHEPPIICDPVHPPPAIIEQISRYPLRTGALFGFLTLVVFPINLFFSIKKALKIEISSGKIVYSLFKKELISALLITIIYSVYCLVFGSAIFESYEMSSSLYFLRILFIILLVLFNFITGIILLFFVIKDRKFLKPGLYFITVLPAITLGLFYLFLKIFLPKSMLLPEDLRR